MIKKADIFFILFIVLLFLPFILSDQVFSFYETFNHEHGLVTSFVKFAVLATIGELIGIRIRTGNYFVKDFGVVPHMVVWGFIGVTIKIAFVIFAVGTPAFLEYMGFDHAVDALAGPLTGTKVFVAFCTSVAMNTIYAPVMMVFHKITDVHIQANHGKLSSLWTPIKFREIFVNLNWDVQWNFVFKKTIPLFWFPAHTITFLLKPDYQVLFAAFLGIMLGVILAVANMMDKPVTGKEN